MVTMKKAGGRMNSKWKVVRVLCALLFVAVSAPADQARAVTADADNDGWVSLIPEGGDELTGWTNDNKSKPDHWKLIDGVIIGENPQKKGSVLWTDKSYGDYELIVEYRTPSKDYDSGVFLRGKSHQVQIGISRSLKKDLTGALYCPVDGKGGYPIQPDEKIKKAHRLGEWNTLRMVTKGKQITTYLNGVEINDYTADKYPDEGRIGLQLHAKVHMKMEFKTVKVRPIGE